MKIKYIILLLLIISSSVLSIFTPQLASAASPFDNTIQLVTEWSMPSGQNPSKTCDFSNNFPLLIDYTPTSSGSHNSTQDISGCSIRYNAPAGLSWQTVRDLWSDADSWVLYKNEPSQLYFFYLPVGTALYNFDLITNGSQLSLDQTFTNSVCGSNQSTSNCILISLNNTSNLSGQDVSFNISRFTQNNNKPVPAMNISSNYIFKPYIFDGNFTINYPPGYDGEVLPIVDNREQVYPGLTASVVPNNDVNVTSKVQIRVSDTWTDWLTERGITSAYYSIITLTDSDDNIIVPDRCWGPVACDWNALPMAQYKARLNIIFDDPAINELYNFNTTEVWFEVNNTAYSLVYNPNEGKYCTVRNGYEWNCQIPQPGDAPSLIDGEPEVWEPGACVIDVFPWVNLPVCVNNVLHYLGEYLGINGPNVSSSPFFQFDTGTYGLASVVTAPISILTSLQQNEYSCSPPNLPLPFIDEDLPLPCLSPYYQEYFTGVYNLFQMIINGIVAYYVLVGMLRTVKDTINPQDDKIEVMKL